MNIISQGETDYAKLKQHESKLSVLKKKLKDLEYEIYMEQLNFDACEHRLLMTDEERKENWHNCGIASD